MVCVGYAGREHVFTAKDFVNDVNGSSVCIMSKLKKCGDKV